MKQRVDVRSLIVGALNLNERRLADMQTLTDRPAVRDRRIGRKHLAVIAMVICVLILTGYYFLWRRSHVSTPTKPAVLGTPMKAAQPAAPKSPEFPEEKDTVAKGDTFSDLVYQLYGDGRRETYEAVGLVVKGLRTPDLDKIYPGQQLSFPAFLMVGKKMLKANRENARRRWFRKHAHLTEHAELVTTITIAITYRPHAFANHAELASLPLANPTSPLRESGYGSPIAENSVNVPPQQNASGPTTARRPPPSGIERVAIQERMVNQ